MNTRFDARRHIGGALVVGATALGVAQLDAQTLECAAGEAVDTATVTLGEHVIRVCYLGRTAGSDPVFGHSLEYADSWTVQYDTLWNMGIVFETPLDVELAGIHVEPGIYGLYAIPSSYEWVIIVRPGADALEGTGAVYDDAARDVEVGRALVRSTSLRDRAGRMVVRGEASGASSADLVIEWDRTQVRVPFRLTESLGDIECALRGAPTRLAQRSSPPDSVDFQLGGETARVCYGRPSARERRIVGGVVPYDDMWRTGANEPTVLHLPVAAEVAGITLAPGDYTINLIPGPRDWVVIIGTATNRWGRVTPTERGGRSQYTDAVRAREVGRAMVTSDEAGSHVEQFTITADPVSGGADLVLVWERMRVMIPVRLEIRD